jgi:hypothetical protein
MTKFPSQRRIIVSTFATKTGTVTRSIIQLLTQNAFFGSNQKVSEDLEYPMAKYQGGVSKDLKSLKLSKSVTSSQPTRLKQ